MLWSFCLGKNRITHLLEVALRFSTLRSAMLTLVRAVPSVESLWSQRFLQKTTCGGASRAILRANRRTSSQSWTVVHSFVAALIYPQPCSTIHPPVEFMTVLNAVSLVARRIAHARFACAKQNLTKSLFLNPIFFH